MSRSASGVLRIGFLGALLLSPAAAAAQVDEARAAAYFMEVAELCQREGGRLWGVSLCGPIVLADPVTKTIATSQPAPDAPRPAALGFANAAMDWGGARWTTVVWPYVPAGPQARARLMIHELFHRVQPQLGLFVRDLPNDHLDTPVGRYWLQLEWRALAEALAASGTTREAVIRDALAFRDRRRTDFRDSAESERLLEIQEGLAQYTGTVVAAGTADAALADAIQQLDQAPQTPTFVRTFAYPSGAAYGLLLDAYAPGWTRRIRATDDLGQLLQAATSLAAAGDVDAAAARYGGEALRASEAARETERRARLAALRRRFIEGPVIVLPARSGASFATTGMTPIPGAGTVYPKYRVSGDWGTLEAEQVLVSPDRTTLTLPAPPSVEGRTLAGDGWTLTLEPGWVVRPGPRPGDYQVMRESAITLTTASQALNEPVGGRDR